MNAHAQPPSSVTPDKVKAALPELEKFVQQAMQMTGVPGVSIALVHQDKVVYLKGFGVREVGKTDPVSVETVFQLASASKPIASTVVAAVVSEGLVSWDSRVSQLDPAFQLYEPYATSQVTIRDLFNHRSGLPGEAGNELEKIIGYSRDEILHRLRFMPPASSFRSAYSYSNFGLTAGAVAAVKPTGKSWEDVSKEKLYDSLGMTQTSSRHADFLKETNRSTLHIKVDGGTSPSGEKWTAKLMRQPDAQSPAGGVSTTPRDLAQWVRLQLGHGKHDGKQLIKPEAIAETHVPLNYLGPSPVTGKASFYGLGWATQYDSEGRVYWTHNGGFSVGARTIVTLVPSEQLGIVVLSNAFPTGLPEAVVDTFFDLVHKGKPQKDYLDLWDKYFDSVEGSENEAVKATYATPPLEPAPALPASVYGGTYFNPYLGDVFVVEQVGGLVLQVGPHKKASPLRHWDRDLFLSYMVEQAPDVPAPVRFVIGADGKVSQVVIDGLNLNGQGILTRTESL